MDILRKEKAFPAKKTLSNTTKPKLNIITDREHLRKQHAFDIIPVVKEGDANPEITYQVKQCGRVVASCESYAEASIFLDGSL